MPRRYLLPLSLVALAFVAALVIANSEGTPAQPDPGRWREPGPLRAAWDKLEGQPAPALDELTGWMNTDARSWQDLRGKVVLLDVWATWCGPCVRGIPHLVQMHNNLADKGLVVLGVHVTNGADRMADFAKSRKLPYALAAETKGEFSDALSVQYIPTYFVIDRHGVMRVAGASRDRLEEIVEALLAEPYDPDAPAPTPKASGPTGYPPIVEKKLYARHDLRGKPAPKLEAEQWLTAEPDTRGKVTLIDFWATWCGPCVAAIPHIDELQKQFKDDLVVIGLSNEKAEVIRSFVEDKPVSYAMAVDTQNRTSNTVGVRGIPHILIIGTDGVVRWQGTPFDEGDKLNAELIQRIINADAGVAARREAQKAKVPVEAPQR